MTIRSLHKFTENKFYQSHFFFPISFLDDITRTVYQGNSMTFSNFSLAKFWSVSFQVMRQQDRVEEEINEQGSSLRSLSDELVT